MPTYEFRCPNGHEFERFYRKISDAEAEVPCPECGAPAQRMVSGGAGLLFKGSGFYLTDYGRNAHRSSGGKSGGGDAGGGSAGGKSESKGSDSASSGGASKGDAAAPAKKPDSKPGS